MHEELQNRWNNFWKTVGFEKMLSVYGPLQQHYSEPHRAYHNLVHITECLAELSSIPSSNPHNAEIEAAIWFHDLIYDPRAKDNEEKSAQVANQWMQAAQVPEEFIRNVASLILATKYHQPKNEAEATLVDIDLAILGREPNRFDKYEQQIREEYSWVPDQAFAEGRSAVLKNFLSREFLYTTNFFRKKYESQAKANLARSLNRWITPVQTPAPSR